MRIIAGYLGGRILKVPNSKLIRPATDKLRESLFNYLYNQIELEGAKVCDIYAGSGSLGFEALSRGASEIHFIEKNFEIYSVLQQNIAALDAEAECRIIKMDAVKFSKLNEHDKYDLILADPPFFKDDIHEVVKNLLEREYLSEEGFIIVQRSVQTEENDIKNFGIAPYKKLGDSLLYRFDK